MAPFLHVKRNSRYQNIHYPAFLQPEWLNWNHPQNEDQINAEITAVIPKVRSTVLMRSGPGLQTAQLLSGLKPTFKALPIMPTQKLILLVTSRTRERVRVCTLLTLSEKQSWSTCPTAWAFILCWVRPPVLYYNQRRAFYNEQRNKQHELQLWILSDAKL